MSIPCSSDGRDSLKIKMSMSFSTPAKNLKHNFYAGFVKELQCSHTSVLGFEPERHCQSGYSKEPEVAFII